MNEIHLVYQAPFVWVWFRNNRYFYVHETVKSRMLSETGLVPHMKVCEEYEILYRGTVASMLGPERLPHTAEAMLAVRLHADRGFGC